MKKIQVAVFMLLLVCFSPLARGKTPPPAPLLTITGPDGACLGSYTSYSVPPAAGISYYWTVTPQGVLVTSNPCNPATIHWVTTGTATIKVVGHDGLGNHVDSATTTVSVYTAPSPYITTFYEVACQNIDSTVRDGKNHEFQEGFFLSNAHGCIMVCDSTVVTYMGFDSTAGHFKWIVSGGTILGSSTSGTLTVDWGAPGSGSITLIDTAIGGCIGRTTICFTIINRPRALFAIAPETGPVSVYFGCINTPLVFEDLSTSSPGSPIVSWQWIFGDGGTSSYENPTHTYTATGTYFVDLVVTNQCGCTDTFKTKVVISELIGPDIECPHVVCAGDTATYTTGVSCAGAIYNWSVQGGTITSGLGTAVITVRWASPPSGFGYVSLQVLHCYTCSDTTTIQIPIIESHPHITGPTGPVCTNTQVQFGIPLWPGTQYYWGVIGYPGDVISERESNVITLNFPTAGTYIVHVTWQSRTNLCGGDMKFQVVVTDPPAIVGDSIICQAAMPTYSLSPSYTGTWTLTGPSGYTFSHSGSSITLPVLPFSGTYILSVAGTGACPPTPLTIHVQATPPPPDAISGPNLVCLGQPQIYTATTAMTGYDFTWSVSPSTSGAPSPILGNTTTVTWSGPGVISVVRTAHDAPHCPSLPLQIGVRIFPAPSGISGPTAACANSTGTYDDNYGIYSADATTWAVYPSSAGSPLAPIYLPTVSVQWNNVAGTAYLVATIRKCDSTWLDSIMVTITPQPTVAITSSPVPVCNGTTVTLNATPGALTYVWSFGDGTTSTTASYTTTHTFTTSVMTTGLVTDVVSVVVHGSDGSGCAPIGVATYSVTVYPGPYASISEIGGTTYCSGAIISTTLNAVVTNSISSTYQWFNSGGAISGATNDTYVATSANSYWLVVTDAGIGISCPVTTNTITVSYIPCTGGGCTGPTVSLTYTVTCNAVHIESNCLSLVSSATWSVDPSYSSMTTTTNPCTGGNVYICDLVYPTAGFKEVTLNVVYLSTCTNFGDADIPIPLQPNWSWGFSCTTPDYTLNLNDHSGVLSPYTTSVQWSVGGAFSPTSSYMLSPATYTVSELITATDVTYYPYSVTCTTSHTVVVPSVTSVDFTYSVTPNCSGTPIAFSEIISGSAPVTGSGSEDWVWGDGSDYRAVPVSDPSRTYVYSGSGSFPFPATLIVTNDLGCSYASPVHVMTVFPNTLGGHISPTTDPIVSCGAPVTLSYASTGGSPTSYTWSDGNSGISDIIGGTGTYFVTVFDAYACRLVTSPRNVVILGDAGLAISGTNNLCQGATVSLSDYVGPDYTYQWYNSVSGLIPGATGSTLTVPGLSPGVYTYSLTVSFTYTTTTTSITCTHTSAPYTVTINATPAAPVVTSTSLGCSPYEVLLTASSGITGAIYTWSAGSSSGATCTVGTGGAVRTWLTDPSDGCMNYTDTYVPPSPETLTGWIPVGCYNYCSDFLRFGGLTLYGPPGIYPYWEWLMSGSPDGSGVTSAISPLSITAPGDYRLTLSTGFCPATFGDMNVTEHECPQCPSIVYSVTAVCDAPGNSAGYLVTFYFNNPYGIVLTGTIGTDIGAVYTMPVSIPLGLSSATYSFTTLDIPPPSFTNGWLHVYYPGGDCWGQFKILLPTCTWTAEKPGTSSQPASQPQGDKATSMLVYPNPAQHVVTVNYNYGTESNADRSIVVYDIYGRVIATQAATGITGVYLFPLDGVAAGSYIVRMEENGHTVQLQHLAVTH